MQIDFAYQFLQSLSIALINSIWQFALLWILAEFIQKLFLFAPVAKYRFLIVIQIFGFVWFIITFLRVFDQSNFSAYYYSYNILEYDFGAKLLSFISIIYLFFVVIMGTKFLINLFSVNELRRIELENISEKWILFVEKISKQLDIKTKIVIKVSKKITSPLTIGFFKPIILIPFASINLLSPEQMEAVLLHELAHIKRKDYLINLLINLIDILLFFNPFSKYIQNQIAKERELCCDDFVIENNYSSKLYAQALLNIAVLQKKKQVIPLYLHAISSTMELKERVKRILGFNENAVSNNTFFFRLITPVIVFITIFMGTQMFNFQSNLQTKNNKTLAKASIEKNTKFTNFKESVQTSNQNFGAVKSVAKTKKLKQEVPAIKVNSEIKQLDNSTENNNITLVSNSLNLDDSKDEMLIEKPITITNAVEKYPIITTNKFFIPATNFKAASVIVVTTVEKQKGKKITTIEIINGLGVIE